MFHRVVAPLLVAVTLATILERPGESWAQTKTGRVGMLVFPSKSLGNAVFTRNMTAFRYALAQNGWTEGENLSFEERRGSGIPPRFSEAAAELVRLRVDIIYANSAPATRAAYAATRTIPIVAVDFTNDPVAEGYAKSYSQPGGNLTGVFLDAPSFAAKWLELLKAIVPGLSRVAVLWDPSPGATHLKAVQATARAIGIQTQVLEVREADDIPRAFSALRPGTQALIVLPSQTLFLESARLAELALRYRLPATSMAGDFAKTGGLLSYGPDVTDAWERCAVLVAKILDGANPGDLPIERPTKLPLLINVRTAKALGLRIPDSILVRADDVIR
jgi:putative ABC transport system substrate-binding protein